MDYDLQVLLMMIGEREYQLVMARRAEAERQKNWADMQKTVQSLEDRLKEVYCGKLEQSDTSKPQD